ncbi:TPA: hypothetical protein L5F86_001575 [Pseudomonas aeruginosa]|nr:hypothetical protein [Pseudomonas aeruginosa]
MTIHGPVGQVAYGDIHNHGVDDLMGMGREQLHEALRICKERLADARRRLLFSWPVGWFLVGVVVFAMIVVTGNAFAHTQLLAASIFLGILLPMFFYTPMAQRFGPMIRDYRLGIHKLEFVLHSRGLL